MKAHWQKGKLLSLQLAQKEGLAITINNKEDVDVMLLNPEDFPLVPMDWFYSNTEMGLIHVPENVQTMQVWMEMTASKEDWNLQNDFPGG